SSSNAEVDNSISAMVSSVVKSIKISRSAFELDKVILPDVDVFSSPGTYLQVVDAGGKIVSRSGNMGPQFLPMSEDTLRMAAAGREFYENVGYGDKRIRIFNYPLILEGKLIGVVQVGRSLFQVEMVLGRLKVLMFSGAVITVLAAGLMGFSVARTAFKPMERIIEAAASIQRGSDLKRRIDYRGPRDELYTLVETLNGMLERLENMYRRLEEINEAQRRFVADASHELRTPLTTIRGNAELLIKMGDSQPDTRAEALADIAGEAERLTRLVSNLLYLARADAGQVIETCPVQLRDLMDRAVDGLKFTTGRRIETEGLEALPEGLQVNVNTDLIIQAVNILVDNAVKYTPAEGEVTLGVSAGGGPDPEKVSIYVRDSGPGIPEEDRQEIFERFYRGKTTRGKSGSGLGLSIAQWILQKHGGRVALSSKEGIGSCFALLLPVDQRSG
ncbi:MAG: HAMP domain-containing histidine kinase, partial [Firmicutes bacterium]|nr:HAMP domain-containing histidine kinase [Bacillota bacterium]